MSSSPKPENKYRGTLNLPQTEFPIRPQSNIDDPAMITRWEKENLYNACFTAHKGQTKFILHHGPPYANGHLHVGHAYTTILKDIVTKSRRMKGMNVPVTPGWDCHGLPIEFKVTQENPGLSRTDLKKACREYAQHWINVQREEFKRMGIVMDWDHPYTTMNFGYEGSTLDAFAAFVEQGYIERKNKTVPWCMTCQTVLATAEIEYQERKDPSLYTLFPLEANAIATLWPDLAGKEVSFAVWTTTPWTLPLNRALLIRPHTEYVVAEVSPERYIIVAKALVEKVAALLQQPLLIKHAVSSEHLIAQNLRAQHPFIQGLTVPLIASDTVQLTDGTAIVHCAPGCGPEDYDVGVKNKLEIFSPLTPAGTYSAGIEPKALEGMKVTDGQIWVIKELAANNKLLHKGSLRHSYPHCWRCHQGLIFRATKQWFCDLSRNNLKQKAVAAIDALTMLPDGGKKQFRATLEGRLEWCLSRQRVWGVPIPALLCQACDFTYITPELVKKVAQGVAQEGISYWDTVSIDQLLPKDRACPSCKKEAWIKEQDILDVWFDSGISHYAVLRKNPALAFPADIYLEGKDQNRGWFQSSLLTALVLEKQAPMKTIVTHGFTVDDQGRKMSKSVGNVVTPAQMMEQLGTDGLRLWAASIDYADDAVVSPVLIENVKEVYRKIRNTARFLLSNLYDYDHAKDAIALEKLLPLDAYALHELSLLQKRVLDAYERYDFTAVFHLLGTYCANDLSALYLDIIKDRLYVEVPSGLKRRSAQTVCWYILDTLTRLMAPILSFTAEQLSDYYQKDKKHSIHLQEFAVLPKVAFAESEWALLLEIRPAVLKAIEKLREQGIVKHSLEAKVTLAWASASPFDDMKSIKDIPAFLKEFFIVSEAIVSSDTAGLQSTEYPGLYAYVEHAAGVKCPRCWNWDTSSREDGLCRRCAAIVK